MREPLYPGPLTLMSPYVQRVASLSHCSRGVATTVVYVAVSCVTSVHTSSRMLMPVSAFSVFALT